MTIDPAFQRILQNPLYKELVARRDRLAWSLTIFVMVIYYGFTLLVAFAGDFLSQPISADSVIPVGMPMGVGVIILSILSTAWYVYRANTTYDQMIRSILQGAGK